MPTLILFGGISERVGRKNVILASLLVAAIASFLMIANPTIYTLFVTRILQGVGVGLITGTGTAYIFALIPTKPAQVTGVLFQPLARRFAAVRSLQLGSMLLVLGYTAFTCGAWLGVMGLVLAGVAIAGTACYRFTYLGGLAEVVRRSGSESARATSGYYVCAYFGYGLPVILIGFFSDQIGIVNILFGFGVILLVCNILLIDQYQRARKEGKLS